jgi:hypothetical protein
MAFNHLLDCLIAQIMAAIEMFVVVEVIFFTYRKIAPPIANPLTIRITELD